MNDATTQAFELVRKHGFSEAARLSAQWRDMNAEGTVSFALHNAVCKRIAEFAAAGACFRAIP